MPASACTYPPIAVVALGDPSRGDDGVSLRIMGRVRTLIGEIGCIRARGSRPALRGPGPDGQGDLRRRNPEAEKRAGSGLSPLAALFLSEADGRPGLSGQVPLIEWVEGGTDVRRLDSVLVGRRRVVLLDAVNLGNPPGTVYHWHLRCSGDHGLSQIRHFNGRSRLGLQHLALWLEDDLPVSGTDLIGIEPYKTSQGDQLSASLVRRLPAISSQVAGLVVRILEEEGW